MSTQHSGNIQNEVTLEEHIGELNAKRVGIVSTATIYAVVNTAIATGNTTVQQGTTPWIVAQPSGSTVFQGTNPWTVAGNTTVYLATATIYAVVNTGSSNLGSVTLNPSPSQIGSVTVSNPITIAGNVTLIDAKTYIGLVSVSHAAWADPKTYIGLVTVTHAGNVSLNASSANIGSVSVLGGLIALAGNVTISDSKGYIGLTTNTPAYGSGVTVYTGVISGTGNTTVLTPPASNRFFLKHIHISSLGRSELEIRSGATTLIPFTGLATTSGYAYPFVEEGLAARAQNDALVINLNGGATIGYMFSVKFAP